MNRAYTAGQHVILNKPKTRKKKNPKNAFSFYLDYALKELRENGQRVANKSEAMPYACEQWKVSTFFKCIFICFFSDKSKDETSYSTRIFSYWHW